MTRLLVHVEGETEETFVNKILAPHFYRVGYILASARLMGNARQRSGRGGGRAWPAVRQGIVNHLNADPGCVVSTMVDYYGLPQTGTRAWPKRADSAQLPFSCRPVSVENALHDDVVRHMHHGFNASRFVPFVMMHEFESLLFSDCRRFAEEIGGGPQLARDFQEIRAQFNTPEHINDSPITAPSKRVLALVPGYQKPLDGTKVALRIGLDAIRGQCPHFAHWLSRLERLLESH
jgi:hypothetical protein